MPNQEYKYKKLQNNINHIINISVSNETDFRRVFYYNKIISHITSLKNIFESIMFY